MLSVMIASGLNQTVPSHGALSAYADIFAQVIQRRATSSGFLHNHPSGDPTPSTADIDMTKTIQQAAKSLGIAVHDHLIIGRSGTTSFRTLKLL